MKTVPVSELSGPALDWAVAKALLFTPIIEYTSVTNVPYIVAAGEVYRPSRSWEQAGPIIEREGISLLRRYAVSQEDGRGDSYASMRHDGKITEAWGNGYLEAAMRCYVASKFGDTVSAPAAPEYGRE